MHDLDRTQVELGWETGDFETDGEAALYGETGLYGEAEMDGEGMDEWYGEAEMGQGLFNEMDEMELAAELLEVSDEAELDQFLGNLIRKASRAVGGVLRSPVGNALGGILKGVARKALPIAGSALGNLVAPGVGGSIGGQLASSAGRLFGLELEGMSAEDQEFEVARRFVRLAGDAVQNAAQMPNQAPATAAQNALVAAAQRHAPGLLKAATPTPMNGAKSTDSGKRRSGRWVRRGNRILLLGV